MDLENPKGGKKTPADGIDRISVLHDSILCHILTFLPTKPAMATSILSTRWKDIFKYVPKMDLDDSLLLHSNQENSCEFLENGETKDNFIQFVSRLLTVHRESCLREFRLKCQKLPSSTILNSWIYAVLQRNIQIFDTWIEKCKDGGCLPSEIFQCQTLVVLKLHGEVSLQIPKSVVLPNLKVLHLENLSVFGNNSSWKFSTGYPLLEELQISSLDLHRLKVLEFSIPSLRKLSIAGCFSFLGLEIVIDTPNLQYLEYNDHIILRSSVKNFKSLVRADLSIRSQRTKIHRMAFARCVSCFIRQMCKAKSLSLSAGTLEGLFYSDWSLPKFENLTKLEVGAHKDFQWRLLNILLVRSPNLQTLDFDMGTWSNFAGLFKFHAPESQPHCLAKHLREVKISNFCGSDSDFELVKYLVQHGKVLERIILCAAEDGMYKAWPSAQCMEWFMNWRCSKDCEIMLT